MASGVDWTLECLIGSRRIGEPPKLRSWRSQHGLVFSEELFLGQARIGILRRAWVLWKRCHHVDGKEKSDSKLSGSLSHSCISETIWKASWQQQYSNQDDVKVTQRLKYILDFEINSGKTWQSLEKRFYLKRFEKRLDSSSTRIKMTLQENRKGDQQKSCALFQSVLRAWKCVELERSS